MTKERKSKLNAMLLARINDLVRHLYPQGKKEGKSWRVGSLDINLRTGMWGDWAGSTDGMRRSLIDLWIFANNVDFCTASDEVSEWLGLPEDESTPLQCNQVEKPPERKIYFPLLEKPTQSELEKLSDLRSISVKALDIAVTRGFLWTYRDAKEGRCWLITDSARKSAIARRLDGEVWQCNGKKSKTIFGSWGHYPIGLADAAEYPAIALVEGSPDFLALIDLALLFGFPVAPVCMAGANMEIPESQLALFAGKRVRIFIHDDAAGRRAAKRWAEQLEEVTEVDGYLCGAGLINDDEEPAHDVNDLLRLDPLSWNDNQCDLEGVLDFAFDKEALCGIAG